MPTLWDAAGYMGYALGAALFAAFSIFTSRRADDHSFARQMLVVALALSALWSLRQALSGIIGVGGVGGAVAETLRNGVWLFYVLTAASEAGQVRAHMSLGRRALVIVLVILLGLQMLLDISIGEGALINDLTLPLFQLAWLFRCMFALGALALLHDMFRSPSQSTQNGINGWIAAALTFMWAYDCNHYGLALVWGDSASAIAPMRGFATALLAPLFAIGLQSGEARSVRISRIAVRRAGGVILALLYLGAIAGLATFAGLGSSPLERLVPIALLFAISVVALAVLPSSGLRSWLRVEVSKHLFAHRYDYRVEWRRFTEAVAEGYGGSRPLGERVARGVAQVLGASAGLTLLRSGGGALVAADGWRWDGATGSTIAIPAEICAEIEAKGWIVDFGVEADAIRLKLSPDLRDDERCWALVPAIHNDLLVGAILLLKPAHSRRLDWEDLDMMRVLGGQVAATISDALTREALVEAQRFEEFNRRFAFILHDIKNQVSQMSLLARNAERHSENPAFRADMVIALRETASRMTELLRKLTKPTIADSSRLERIELGSALRRWVQGWPGGKADVRLSDDLPRDLWVSVDGDALERALSQLVQNGIEASGGAAPVQIALGVGEGVASITVLDSGSGMSAEFIRTGLFRPFASTKPNGFGLGAQEAKTLVEAMGGTLEVASELGNGTCFIIHLPLISRTSGGEALPKAVRKSA